MDVFEGVNIYFLGKKIVFEVVDSILKYQYLILFFIIVMKCEVNRK